MWILNTNLVAYFRTIKTALPYLRKTKGVIVNTGSVLGLQGDEGACAYTATKGAIATMTRTIAMDEARYGVRCVEVKPGHINTHMFFQTTSEQADPEGFVAYSDSLQWLNRGGEPEEIAYAVLFLASPWASFVTGTDLLVTGGYEIGEGPKPINPFMASNKDENGVDLFPDQRPLMKWIDSLQK
jgi:NAD(P)-dependent dehydrogenase (short-subunit alcohol dehydrogenase family)